MQNNSTNRLGLLREASETSFVLLAAIVVLLAAIVDGTEASSSSVTANFHMMSDHQNQHGCSYMHTFLEPLKVVKEIGKLCLIN